jgi:hypothetical protein
MYEDGAYRVWVENVRERDHLELLSTYGRIILIWTFKNACGRAWNDSR